MNQTRSIKPMTRKRAILLSVALGLIGAFILHDATWCEAHTTTGTVIGTTVR